MRWFIGSLFLGLAGILFAQHSASSPAWSEASEATKRFQLSAGLKLDLWATEPQLSNSVAFAFDSKGQAYLAESDRWAISVFDITTKTNWLLADMAFRSVADRGTFLTNAFATNLSFLTRESEVVRRVSDRDGDGRADHSEILAQGFRDAVDGTAAGILASRDGIYFANIPSLWRFPYPSPSTAPAPIEAHRWKPLATGFGVHIGVSGHDLHGLIQGPDGRIYLSFGDRGASLTNREGRRIHLPDCGGVLRCEPDGRSLEVFCYGLRNPQELAFDDEGNWWTVDNDTAGADPCRVLHLVEGGDYGWRTSYQHMEGFGQWVKEELWRGGRDGTLPLAGTVSQGPSGLAFYPGTGFGERLAGTFLHADFPGGVWAYTVKPSGASFVVDRKEKFLWNCWPTDVDFGPDGAAYVLDWVSGWGQTPRGRIYRITPTQAPTEPEAALVAQTRQLLAEGFSHRPDLELATLLGHADRRIRLEAQWDLARRGPAVVNRLLRTAQEGSFLARRHAVWALGQLARNDPGSAMTRALQSLVPLINGPDPILARCAAQVLAENGVVATHPALVNLLESPDISRRATAIDGLRVLRSHRSRDRFEPDSPAPVRPDRDTAQQRPPFSLAFPWKAFRQAVLADGGADLFLRSMAERCLRNERSDIGGGRSGLSEAGSDADPRIRELAVGAIRWIRKDEPIFSGESSEDLRPFLSDNHPSVVTAAARAIYDVPCVEGLPALAQFITRVDCPTNLLTRVIQACQRLGAPQHAQQLAQLAKRRDATDFARIAALEALADWAHPPQLDAVVGLWRPAFGGAAPFELKLPLDAPPAGVSAPGSEPLSPVKPSAAKAPPKPTAPSNPLLAAAMEATAGRGTTSLPLPQLPPDLGRSLEFSEAQTFKRNAEPAKRAFLKVAGEIMNPQTPDEYGLRLGGGPSSTGVQLALVATAVKLRTREASTPLFEVFSQSATPVNVRRAIVEALSELRAGQTDEALRIALQEPQLQSAALPYLGRLAAGTDSAILLSNLVQRAASGDSLKTAQIALNVLGTLDHEAALPALIQAIERWKSGTLAPELELDLREAVAKTSLSNALPTRKTETGTNDTLAIFRVCLVGGDAQRGRQLFREHPTIQCLRCHQVGNEGGTVGPKLDGIGRRQNREYLLESIVWPNQKIAPSFETVALTLKDGALVSGTVKSETANRLSIETLSEEGTPSLRTIPIADIARRDRGPSAMPEGLATALTPRELRDLIEYLATLR
ncbi:MAG: PQQ-dependent sugar dehydrogenase [Verrucomicrobiota bacterium]|nr:PQQ-dependent sugar dehydrogenase [Verrucomicrobiota bacterium]